MRHSALNAIYAELGHGRLWALLGALTAMLVFGLLQSVHRLVHSACNVVLDAGLQRKHYLLHPSVFCVMQAHILR